MGTSFTSKNAGTQGHCVWPESEGSYLWRNAIQGDSARVLGCHVGRNELGPWGQGFTELPTWSCACTAPIRKVLQLISWHVYPVRCAAPDFKIVSFRLPPQGSAEGRPSSKTSGRHNPAVDMQIPGLK